MNPNDFDNQLSESAFELIVYGILAAMELIVIKFGRYSITIRSEFYLKGPNNCKTNDIPINFSCVLYCVKKSANLRVMF